MITKRTANKNVNSFHKAVFNSLSQVGSLIRQHSEIGFIDMEVFVPAKNYAKFKISLEKKGYYIGKSEFVSVPKYVAMYVNWDMSY